MKKSPGIEPLESRIAPASVLAFTDVDGDLVKVSSTAGDLNAAGVATLDDAGGGKMLRLLDLRDASFQGATIKTTVTRAPAGDGLVHIGRIDATGRDLGTVTIKGDLGAIDAGDPAAPALAVKVLDVDSMGRWGLLTQGGGGDLVSNFDGSIGPVKVKHDLRETFLDATGSIAGITLGGSLIGGDTDFSGVLKSLGNMGPVKIAGDVIGGAATNSARILAGDINIAGNRSDLVSLTVGGSLIGSKDGFSSGRVLASANIGNIIIGHDVRGGGIFSWNGDIGNVTIGGSIIGMPAGGAGTVFSGGGGNLGSVIVRGDVIGSSFAGSGVIHSDGTIKAVQVGGSILGGPQLSTGQIEAYGDLGPVKVGGNLVAGTASDTGTITSYGKIARVTIGGSMSAVGSPYAALISAKDGLGPVRIAHDVGSPASGGVIESTMGGIASVNIGGSFSGKIDSAGNTGAVTIGGDMAGYTLFNPGLLRSDGSLKSLTVRGSVVGGTSTSTGDIEVGGVIGFIKITGDLRGGSGAVSGAMRVGGPVSMLSIGGSVVGGAGDQSGMISVARSVNAMTIGGDLRGASIANNDSLTYSGFISVGVINSTGGRLGSLTIGGSIIAGIDDSTGSFTRCASIRVADDIGSLTVKGSILGNAEAGDAFVDITAAGQKSNAAFGKITVGGRVEIARILGGYGASVTSAINGNAQIGAVTVAGDWDASSISAGINENTGGFGDGDDSVADQPAGAAADAILSRIASITIKGTVIGAPNPFFNTGFVAQQIGSFKAGGYVATLTSGTDGPFTVTPFLPNVTVREI